MESQSKGWFERYSVHSLIYIPTQSKKILKTGWRAPEKVKHFEYTRIHMDRFKNIENAFGELQNVKIFQNIPNRVLFIKITISFLNCMCLKSKNRRKKKESQ